MRVIAVINLKGGVAKTTTTVSMASILAERGFRVLVIDNDKQGDASRGLGRRSESGEGIDQIMVQKKPDMENLIQSTDIDNLDIITANMRLLTANKEVTMDQRRPQQNRIRKALAQVQHEYDFCIIDNAPDINISTINAMVAATDVIIPMEIDDNTTEGIKELLEVVNDVKEEMNPDMQQIKCLVTKFDMLNEAHRQMSSELRNTVPNLFQTKIRFSRKVTESTFVRMPIPIYSRRSAAALDYERMTTEYLDEIGYERREENGKI